MYSFCSSLHADSRTGKHILLVRESSIPIRRSVNCFNTDQDIRFARFSGLRTVFRFTATIAHPSLPGTAKRSKITVGHESVQFVIFRVVLRNCRESATSYPSTDVKIILVMPRLRHAAKYRSCWEKKITFCRATVRLKFMQEALSISYGSIFAEYRKRTGS